MSKNLYLVYSLRPDRISNSDYHKWYTRHAQENIQSPDFVSVQRYTVTEIVKGAPTTNVQHLALYEFDGEMSTWRSDLDRRIKKGEIELPDWFSEIQFNSWACEPVGDLLRPKR